MADDQIIPLRVGGKVRTIATIQLNDRNQHIRFDAAKSGNSKQTVYGKISQILPGTPGEVEDYTDAEVAIRFKFGLDWTSYVVWIKRIVFPVCFTVTALPE